jgi:hypothetical protein
LFSASLAAVPDAEREMLACETVLSARGQNDKIDPERTFDLNDVRGFSFTQ